MYQLGMHLALLVMLLSLLTGISVLYTQPHGIRYIS